MSGLSNKTPKQTYKDLLYVDDGNNSNSGIESSIKQIYSGSGTTCPLYISSTVFQYNTTTNNIIFNPSLFSVILSSNIANENNNAILANTSKTQIGYNSNNYILFSNNLQTHTVSGLNFLIISSSDINANFAYGRLVNPKISGSVSSWASHTLSGGTTSISLYLEKNNYSYVYLNQSSNNISITMSDSYDGVRDIYVFVHQPASGGKVPSFVNTTFANGASVANAPTTGNSVSLYRFVSFNKGANWLGQYVCSWNGVSTSVFANPDSVIVDGSFSDSTFTDIFTGSLG